MSFYVTMNYNFKYINMEKSTLKASLQDAVLFKPTTVPVTSFFVNVIFYVYHILSYNLV